MASSRVLSFSCVLLFQGIISFKSTSLPHFKLILDSFVNYSIGTLIHVGVFTTRICDVITLFVSMNASGIGFSPPMKTLSSK